MKPTPIIEGLDANEQVELIPSGLLFHLLGKDDIALHSKSSYDRIDGFVDVGQPCNQGPCPPFNGLLGFLLEFFEQAW